MVTRYGQADVPREVSGHRANRRSAPGADFPRDVCLTVSHIPFIQYKYIASTTMVKLWNYKSNDLPKNGLPMRVWRRQPSHQLNKVSKGRRPEHLLNSTGTALNYNCVPQYMWGYFSEMRNKSHWIQQRIYRLTVCNRRAFALSRRCRVSRSCPRVFHETKRSYHCDVTIAVLVTMKSP